MIQSLGSVDDLESFFAKYELIVVDECHHLPAFSFESSIKKAAPRYVLGADRYSLPARWFAKYYNHAVRADTMHDRKQPR